MVGGYLGIDEHDMSALDQWIEKHQLQSQAHARGTYYPRVTRGQLLDLVKMVKEEDLALMQQAARDGGPLIDAVVDLGGKLFQGGE